jgi:RNA polymerase sigma-70 factor, ECF subfamily
MARVTQETQFASWMREYAFIGVRIARAFEFEREAQADLLQEIFLQWWRSIPNLRRADNPKPWLYSVSLNVAITWQRQEARRGRVIDRAAPFAQLVENVAQPVDSTIDRHEIEELYGAIQQLRLAERAIIILHLDGLSYEEIAGTLGISANAVGSRLTRARANLGKILKGVKHDYERV